MFLIGFLFWTLNILFQIKFRYCEQAKKMKKKSSNFFKNLIGSNVKTNWEILSKFVLAFFEYFNSTWCGSKIFTVCYFFFIFMICRGTFIFLPCSNIRWKLYQFFWVFCGEKLRKSKKDPFWYRRIVIFFSTLFLLAL